jgi:hypothetical protein
LSACASKPNVSTDFSDKTDFSSFKAYRWYVDTSEKKSQVNEIVDGRIRDNINAHLQAKGVEMKDEGSVDFLLHYTITASDEVDIHTYNTYAGYSANYYRGGYGYGYRGGYYGPGGVVVLNGIPTTETDVTRYRKGTLVIDMVDPTDNTLLWRSVADQRLPEKVMAVEKRDETIKNVIDKMMADFPPETGTK